MAAYSTIKTTLGLGLAGLLMPASLLAADPHPPLTGDLSQTLPKVEAPKAPQVSVQIQSGNRNSALEQLLAQPITPSHFAIEGVKALPFNVVAALFAPLAGKQVTVGDLVRTSNAVTKLYQDRGYVLSSCFIPAQDFAGGNVHVVVVEGYVGKVSLSGNPGAAESKIRAIAGHMLEDRPLRRETFERVINLLNQLPGIKMAANVPPPQNVGGETELQLTVSRKPISGGVGLQFNQPGTQGIFSVSSNSLTPLAEQISASFLAPRGRNDEEYYSASIASPLGSNGLMWHLDGSHFRSQPQSLALDDLKLKQKESTDKLGVTLSYPFLLSNTRNLTGSLTFYASNNDNTYTSTVNGASQTSKSDDRVLQSDLSYSMVSGTSVLRLGASVAKGMNALGASRDITSSQTPGHTELGQFDLNFTKFMAQASLSQQWPLHLGTVLSASGQYSRNSLPSSEQVSFGGSHFGLAYPPGELAGDSGWGASFEVNRAFALAHAYLKQVQPYLVADFAQASLNQAALTHDQISSLGVGLRFSDNAHYNLDFAIARPVGQKPVERDSRSPRWSVSYAYQFE